MQGARNRAAAIGNEIKAVQQAPDLRTLHRMVDLLSREVGRRTFMTRLRRSKGWNDIGALKRSLLDYWIDERNQLFRETVKDVKEQRLESTGGPLQDVVR